MSVEPGAGGQTFINSTIKKIKHLDKLRNVKSQFLIQVDGGINNKTIHNCRQADIVVVGSYITNYNDYDKQLKNLQEIAN